MGGHGVIRLISMVLLAHVTITWVHFSSTIYPYTISQPSSFSHIVYPKDPRHKLDYFSPALGSATTDVNIIAMPGGTLPDPRAYLRDQGGFHVRSDGWVTVESHRRRITEADFQSFGNRWTVEQISFVARDSIWRLTASYDLRYRSLRPIMLRMLSSFKLISGVKKH